MRILPVIAFGAAVLTALPAIAAENDGVGKALAVIDAASAAGQIGKRTLAVGSEVFLGDKVATDSGGEAQLLFSDGTRMVVGPNSSLVIDKFLFRGKAAENKFAVRALGGAFRFISGESGDKNYAISTPNATIGVRGTAFDFTVTEGGTSLVLLKGAATLCGESGDCATVARSCELVKANPAGVDIVDNERLRVGQTRRDFPYMISQASLLAGFKLDGRGCTTDVAQTVTPPEPTIEVSALPEPILGVEPAPAPDPGPGPVADPTPEPAPDPVAEPEPDPAPEPTAGHANNGIGNGGEVSQGEDPAGGGDPSNPGIGNKGGGTTGVGASAASSDGTGNNGGGNGMGGGRGRFNG